MNILTFNGLGMLFAPLESHDAAVQIVFVGALDPGGDDLADLQWTSAGNVNCAIDLRGIRLGATPGNSWTDFVDNHLLARADLALQSPCRDFLLPRHQRIVAMPLDAVRNRARKR